MLPFFMEESMKCSCQCQPTLNMKIKKGESLGFVFDLKQNNEPVDLSGAEVLFQVRENLLDDGVFLINKTITENSSINTIGQIINPTEGQFVIKVTSEDTQNLTSLRPYYAAIYYVIDGITRCISANSDDVALLTVLNP